MKRRRGQIVEREEQDVRMSSKIEEKEGPDSRAGGARCENEE